ncbi:hypothetical protein BDP27DRAFT_1315591 [Rhodocollybia butyracea]|uniref:DUF7918 domain-containing protein n=1 Tax=Rhodocollybia butyracea TaxID=206335 RepID=A0A9P5UDG8_9AGAR|nr:hypothetical protein BDP27DRAFT_1315591 [Rhodocollybia butyracea]
MLTHRGFSAWVVVDGSPAKEYLTAVSSNSNQVSCWIEGIPNKAFSIHWSDSGGKVDTCSFITLDGVLVPGRFLLGSGATFRSGVRTSKNTEAPFVFKQFQHATDNVGTPSSSKAEAGMITLKIKRVDRVSSRPANLYQDVSKLSEAGQRQGAICTGFGEDNKSYEQSPYTWTIKGHDPSPSKSKKIATHVSFVFRYRTREFLQTQGIITEPDPVPDTPPIPKRVPVRRIVSAPAGAAPPTPSPTPPLRPQKPYIAAPYPLRRPTIDTRRIASWRPTPSASSQPLSYYGPKSFYSPDSSTTRDGSDSEYNASQ